MGEIYRLFQYTAQNSSNWNNSNMEAVYHSPLVYGRTSFSGNWIFCLYACFMRKGKAKMVGTLATVHPGCVWGDFH